MINSKLLRIIDLAKRTPLHPQWLLGPRRSILPWLKSNCYGRVLDIGCADRWIENHLSQQCEYLGLDYPATGRALYKAKPHVFADARQLPLRDGSIDTVIMLEVLEHLYAPKEALEEAARVLKPGGNLILSMPFLYPIHDAPHDFQRYTTFGIRREVMTAGLQVSSVSHTHNAIHSAGLLLCLALGGSVIEAIRYKKPSSALLPLVLVMIPIINMLSWLGGKLLPVWPALTAGYTLIAQKPCSQTLQ